MFVPVPLLLALAAPPNPVAADAVLSADAQWAAVAACPRMTAGPGGDPVGAAVCVGVRKGFAYLLTADHLVPKGEPRGFEFFTKESYPTPARSAADTEVVARLAAADVALVEVRVGVDPPPVLPLAGPGRRPKRFPAAAVAVGCDPLPGCRADAIAGKELARRPDEAVAFVWRTEAAGGSVGGPLVSADGRVIGVATGDRTFAHLDEVLAGLKRTGYGWLFAPPPDK